MQRDIIMQKDVIRSKRVLTMLSQMCDETAAKLRLISDMAELDKQKLADRAKEFEEQCEMLSKALEEKSLLCTFLLSKCSRKPKLGCMSSSQS